MTASLITFLFEIANFVIFVVLLSWFFVKPVRQFLDNQAARDAEAQRQANQRLADAEDLRQTLLQQQQQFAQQMERQRQKLLDEARQAAQGLIEDAHRNIESQRQQLVRDASQIQQRQRTELTQRVATTAAEAVSRLLREIDGPELETALVSSACHEISQARKTESAGSLQPILVESSIDLDDALKTRIAKAFGHESIPAEIQFKVNETLLGGLRIRTAAGLVDHSIAGLSQFVQQKLQRELIHDE